MIFSPKAGRVRLPQPPRKRIRLLYEHRISLYSLLVALPGMVVGGIFLWLQPWQWESRLALFIVVVMAWWILAMALHEQTVRPLQTLANVIAALREEDYSFRARGAATDDALGELSIEVNALADSLADQRIRAIEAAALLRRVVEEIDAPLFTFDPGHVLRLVNPAGEKLLQQPAVRLLGRTAKEIGLDHCLGAANESLVAVPATNSSVRWLIRQSAFREKGIPHTLIVLSDISRALREEERSAWRRLIRVLGHELNNSLAPIKSIAGSLSDQLAAAKLDPGQRQDFARGLEIIEARSASLNRFLQAYRHLAQMPPPVLRATALRPLVERVIFLETRFPVAMLPGPSVDVTVDSDQLEQMLINLVRNAVEAVLEPASTNSPGDSTPSDPQKPEVTLSWKIEGNHLALIIDDSGPGLLNPSNAFVPFYTTKTGGSGIGLVLCRQIAEAHGGSIDIANLERRGCRVTVRLPQN